MIYEWNDEKNASNRRKHKVDFVLVENLDWDSAVIIPQHHESEIRYLTYAKIDKRVYALIWTKRFDKIRVVSLRKANKREVRNYDRSDISNT